MIPFLRRLSAVTLPPSALVIRRGVIALGGGACVAVCALILGQAAQPHLHPLVAVADTRPTIIDGPPTNVQAAPPPVAPRLRRPRADPSVDDEEDDYEDASVAAPDQAEPPQATQAPWQDQSQGAWRGQAQAEAQAQAPAPAPRSAAQTQAAWPYRCAGFSSPADRMVCAFPRLNAAEVALQRVYGMALYRTDDPDALRDQQRRWRAVRDQVAEEEGPQGLAEFYAERIQELDGGAYY